MRKELKQKLSTLKIFCVKKSTMVLTIFIFLLSLFFYSCCSYYLNSHIETNAIINSIKDILLAILSITGTNLLLNVIVETKNRNQLISDIISNDVISAPEFYDNMDNETKLKMYNALEKSLYFKYDITQNISSDMRKKLVATIGDYYYKSYKCDVTCNVTDTYIEKVMKKQLVIMSFEGKYAIKNFSFGTFSSAAIEGEPPFVIKEIHINGKKVSNADYCLKPFETTETWDQQNQYNAFVKCEYQKKLLVHSTEETIVDVEYVTRVSRNDSISTYRVSKPCKNFYISYSVKQSDKYRIFVDAFGFLDKANHSTNNSETSSVNIQFSDWIFKYDGVTIALLEKTLETPVLKC